MRQPVRSWELSGSIDAVIARVAYTCDMAAARRGRFELPYVDL